MNETNLVQSVDRALRIIVLAENPTGAGITEISKSLGLSKGTVHRLISTLKERDFAYQSSRSNCRILAIRLYLYNCISNNIDMFKVSRPIIRKFADKVDATVHLATLDEKRSNIVYIDKNRANEFSKTICNVIKGWKKSTLLLYCCWKDITFSI